MNVNNNECAYIYWGCGIILARLPAIGGIRVLGRFKGIRGSRTLNIRTTLLLSYFTIILICIALVGSVAFSIAYNSMQKQVEDSNVQFVRQIEVNLDNDFHNKRNVLLAPYYSEAMIDGINDYASMKEQSRFLFRQELGNLFLKSFNITPIRDFVRFQIYYSDGELLSSSDNYKPWTAAQARASDWFRGTVELDGKVFFSGIPAKQPGAEEAAYATSLLIRDFANPDQFIIVRAEYSNDLLRNISPKSAATRMIILDSQDRQVYDTAGADKPLATRLMSRLGSASGQFWHAGAAGDDLVSYVKSRYSGWKIVLMTPQAEIFAPLEKIKTSALMTVAVAFVLAFLISVLFGRSITKPILDMYKTVNRIKRGDFSLRVPVGRNDEIGRIAMNFNAMQDELQHLFESKYLYQIRLQEMQLAMLYSQINPHFLYNTLDSIKAMADYYKVQDIGAMAQSLADMFRYNTKNRDDVVTLQEELVQIEAYMNIQQIRFDDKLSYVTEIEEELYSFPLLKMTLQPLVENAVFHGIERKRGKGLIHIAAYRDQEQMVLAVSDDGVGISETRLAELLARLRPSSLSDPVAETAGGGGIGISNVYSRYAIRYGERFAMTVDSRKGRGTCITLRLSESEG